jgi:hypothetical protein
MIRAELTRQVTGTRDFDLDDLRTHVRKLVAAERARQYVGKVQDSVAGQRTLQWWLLEL